MLNIVIAISAGQAPKRWTSDVKLNVMLRKRWDNS